MFLVLDCEEKGSGDEVEWCVQELIELEKKNAPQLLQKHFSSLMTMISLGPYVNVQDLMPWLKS